MTRSSNKKNQLLSLGIAFLFVIAFFAPESAFAGQKSSKLEVSLADVWKTVLKKAEGQLILSLRLQKKAFEAKLWYETAKNYYQIQLCAQSLKKSSETKGHFDQAIAKAEEGYDDDDGKTTQFIITQLKIGRAEVEDAVTDSESKLAQAKIALEGLTGKDYSDNTIVEIGETLKPAKFSFNNWEDFYNENLDLFDEERSFTENSFYEDPKIGFKVRVQQAFIRVIEARKKMKSSRKTKKSIRALMAMESSNYDLGLGDPVDLFNSFLLYSRNLSLSLDSIYTFNMAVAEWRRVTRKIP
jgi:outer membrane protein TolC